MNGAQTYKSAFHRKKTYIISIIGAAALALVLAFFGIEEGIREEEAMHAAEPEVISTVPYAKCFMEHAPEIGWDWELLAAVAFQESHYNPNAKSSGGACGLMQLMPKTYTRLGLNDSTVFIAEENIAAGTQCFGRLQEQFKFIKDPKEQTKFVLASYNAGPAHILDARRLAQKYGANPNNWDDTEYYLDQLKYEEFYTDSVVKYGSFQGNTTIAYVHSVLRKCERIKRDEKKLQETLAKEQEIIE